MSEKKKVISVMIPTYNEEENARPIYEAVSYTHLDVYKRQHLLFLAVFI